MGTDAPSVSAAARPVEAQRAAVLAAIGAWTATVPYLGEALGLVVEVAARVEVVDHVVPGALVVASGLYLHRLARQGALSGRPTALLASGVAFLAGVWVLATHVPLFGDAARTDVSWEAAIWHSLAALPIVALAAWFVLRSVPDP